MTYSLNLLQTTQNKAVPGPMGAEAALVTMAMATTRMKMIRKNRQKAVDLVAMISRMRQCNVLVVTMFAKKNSVTPTMALGRTVVPLVVAHRKVTAVTKAAAKATATQILDGDAMI
jgi:hypothetical protein